jgi:hypothetical protein
MNATIESFCQGPPNGYCAVIGLDASAQATRPGGFLVGARICGSHFGNSQGSSTVNFNGTTASVSGWIDTSITAAVPWGATSGPVVVTVSGAPSNGLSFTVIPPPSLSGLDPTSGPVRRHGDDCRRPLRVQPGHEQFTVALTPPLRSPFGRLRATVRNLRRQTA